MWFIQQELARKGSPTNLQGAGVKKDTIYARPPGKVETRPATADDLQEILELAADVALRRYLVRARRIGAELRPTGESDEDMYAKERGEL